MEQPDSTEQPYAPFSLRSLYRTDLAVEQRECRKQQGDALNGVRVREHTEPASKIHLTVVDVLDDAGASALGKPVGTYVTLEGGCITAHDDESIQKAALLFGTSLEKLLPANWRHLFVVGLGNANMTADSLGPKVMDQLLVNRHLSKNPDGKTLSGLAPGVMGQTGIETVEIAVGVTKQTRPDAVLVIDALAARSAHRLGNTIQLADTGIQPGSGVGNHRKSLTEETLGVPVIAIGIPTVIGASAIAYDTLDAILQVMEDMEQTKRTAAVIRRFDDTEKLHLIRELLEPCLGQMYVTPKDIDSRMKELSTIIAEGIHHLIYH